MDKTSILIKQLHYLIQNNIREWNSRITRDAFLPPNHPREHLIWKELLQCKVFSLLWRLHLYVYSQITRTQILGFLLAKMLLRMVGPKYWTFNSRKALWLKSKITWLPRTFPLLLAYQNSKLEESLRTECLLADWPITTYRTTTTKA